MTCSIAFGMYQSNAPWSWGEISSVEGQINRHSAIVHWYSQWGNQSGVFNPTVIGRLNATRGRASTPMITWEPWDTYPITNNPYPLSQVAAGAFDTYIDSWASGMAAYGHPVLLAFAQEMNGNWYPWGDTVNGSTPAAYIAAARHIHDRFMLRGAHNVQWVFDPDGDMYGSFPNLQLFYPGDAYVDWLGVDVYNSGTTHSWSSWQQLSSVLRLAYARLTALNALKPVMLAEWASVEQGGSKAQWILNAAAALPAQFPRVRAAVWFSQDKSQLALTSSAAALSAARTAFGSAPFCSTLPY
jgi:beta-mannanase